MDKKNIDETQYKFVTTTRNISMKLRSGNIKELIAIAEQVMQLTNLLRSQEFIKLVYLDRLASAHPELTKKWSVYRKSKPELLEEIKVIENELIEQVEQRFEAATLTDLLKEIIIEQHSNLPNGVLKPLQDSIERRFNFREFGLRVSNYPNQLLRKRAQAQIFFNIWDEVLNSYFELITVPKKPASKKRQDEQQILFHWEGFSFELDFGRKKSRDAKQLLLELLNGPGQRFSVRDSSLSLVDKPRRDGKSGTEIIVVLSLTVNERVETNPVLDPNRIMGIDLGINYPAFASVVSRSPHKKHEGKYFHKEVVSQAFGSKEEYYNRTKSKRRQKANMDRKLRDGGKIARRSPTWKKDFRGFVKDYNNRLANEMIHLALKHKVHEIRLEDLDFNSTFKNKNFFLKDWDYAELRDAIIYKAQKQGMNIVIVDPKYTSQRCNKCKKKGQNHLIKEKYIFRRGSIPFKESFFVCSNRRCDNHYALIKYSDKKNLKSETSKITRRGGIAYVQSDHKKKQIISVPKDRRPIERDRNAAINIAGWEKIVKEITYISE